jgi:hypothetical protein
MTRNQSHHLQPTHALNSLRLLQQRRCLRINLPYTPTTLRRLQFSRRSTAILTRSRLLQPLAVRRVGVLGLGVLVVTVAEAEGVVVVGLGMRGYGSQGLPLLAALGLVVGRRVAVEGVDFVHGAALGRCDGGRLKEVGICAWAA